ncbi:alpha/beta-hydrolase [Delitschia confertaspora ATCC 74209]|uniref:Carboxylic ester hydrolase n=1 Tax=Delitschia confertaspora ATCC 74209 TaxID=1513339 RepID=A0A9P4JKJ4_9PLEO|nr:alpha/beta-hydrolase [Delitschia confertaspora ATCC 74209]
MMRGFCNTAVLLLLSSFDAGVVAEPIPLAARAAITPTVDLGYSVYQGSYDNVSKINVFKGIRYAAPPLGSLRFQAPQAPPTNRTTIIQATSDPPVCPQTGVGADTPAEYGFGSALGNEDCLFLNVYAPANAFNLPVFFWIHGGAYNVFSMQGIDATPLMATNNNKFITVVIQYRLGAFGFLPGEDVKENGALNAGLLDMNLALQWVQKYIKKFGGDPSRVTIGGESAGAGAVMYQSMAYGGKQKQNLFNNIIAQSPWVPNQYSYNDPISTSVYDNFVEAAGCSASYNTFKCLVGKDTEVLQNASFAVSEAKPFGTWAFLPVTDGSFIQQQPSMQLESKSLHGKRILSGNNANEGVPLSPPTVRTVEEFEDYLRTTFPSFNDEDLSALKEQYSYDGDEEPTNPNAPKFNTPGIGGAATAKNVSAFGTGQTQRTFNVFAEYAFDCPSYWLASAFPQAWKYQYSVPPSYHGADLPAYWSTQNPNAPGKGVKRAVQKIWGNFIVHNSPIVSVTDAKGGMSNATVPVGRNGNIEWPLWRETHMMMLNLNTTGGVASTAKVNENLSITTYLEPGVTNQISLVDANSWEGGRGERCKWWKEMAEKIPY